jgi:hypothetical protein
MPKVSLIILLILAANGFCNAATFECQFSPKAGDENSSCQVDTAVDWKLNKCRQDYSGTLFARCDGRSPGGVNQLICYFANPANPPNLDAKSIINQAGVDAVAIEWLGTFPPSAGAPLVLDYKDGEKARSVSCAPN